ncbi:MAG: hypothetical protein JW909_06270 [Planctomycetes bacterium]|nr:hypothetical protein [Planctomycetota bacterium]
MKQLLSDILELVTALFRAVARRRASRREAKRRKKEALYREQLDRLTK